MRCFSCGAVPREAGQAAAPCNNFNYKQHQAVCREGEVCVAYSSEAGGEIYNRPSARFNETRYRLSRFVQILSQCEAATPPT